MKSKTLICFVIIQAATLSAQPSWAISISWNVPGDGVFQDPNNWNPNQAPGPADDVLFQNGASPTVTFGDPVDVNSLSISTGNVTLQLGGADFFAAGNIDIGAMSGPDVSLQVVNGGLFGAGGTVNVKSNAELSVNGSVDTSQIVIDPGGQLRGTMTINPAIPGGSTSVNNSGAVAPGDMTGVITINGDYEQTPVGLLETEVGGFMAGTHDQLSVNGAALLAGRLDMPILPSYTPALGHTITLLQATGVSGSFEFITVPDLPAMGVAVQVGPPPAGSGVVAYFVSPTVNSFAGGPGPHFWGSPTTWGGVIPTTTDVVTIAASAPSPERIDLDPNSTASSRAFAHSVSLFGATDTMTLGVPEATALSAISNVTVGDFGRLELSSGTVYTNLVQVIVGGTVSGAGRIVGNVVVGTDAMSGQATLDPDYTLGELNIEQDLTINSDGVLQIAIDDVSSFDQLVVNQTTTRGGRLVIDAANYVAPVGTQFTVMVSGGFSGNFDSVETVGSTSVFFATPPTPILEVLGPQTYTVQSYALGDMNLDNFVDANDAPDFVLGLLDPLQYWATHGFMFPIQAGNFHADSSFDFDDIQGFADAVGALSAEEIYTLIAEMSVPEPTTGVLLLCAVGLLGANLRSLTQRRGVRGEVIGRCKARIDYNGD